MESAEVGDLEAARRKRDAETPKRSPGRGPLPSTPPPGWGDETTVNRENSMAMTELRRLQDMRAREGE